MTQMEEMFIRLYEIKVCLITESERIKAIEKRLSAVLDDIQKEQHWKEGAE